MLSFSDKYIACQKDLITRLKHKDSYFSRHDISVKHLQDGETMITKFKYEDKCKFTMDWQNACRGTTIIQDKKGNISTYFCLNKFFNIHQLLEKIEVTFEKLLSNLKIDGYKFLYMPKYDGSCVQCFTDKFDKRHRYTLGDLEKNTIGASNNTYYAMTDKLLKHQYPDLYDFLDENHEYSLICEIMTPDNIIKTIYDHNKQKHGFIKPLVLIKPDGTPTFYKESIDMRWSFDETNYEQIRDNAFKNLEDDPDKYGVNPEGLVAYCYKNNMCFPIAKCKRPEYIDSLSCNFNLIVERKNNQTQHLCGLQMNVINNTIDDVQLNDDDKCFVSEFTTYLNKVANEFDKLDFLKSFLSQKQFMANLELLPISLKPYKEALINLRKIGFEFKSGYDMLMKLLKLPIKGKTVLETFQGGNNDWFRL